MSALKIVAGSVAVAGVAVVGYKAIQRYRMKRAEKKMHEAIDAFADELGKIFDTPEFRNACK
jgi:hypothetical protein